MLFSENHIDQQKNFKVWEINNSGKWKIMIIICTKKRIQKGRSTGTRIENIRRKKEKIVYLVHYIKDSMHGVQKIGWITFFHHELVWKSTLNFLNVHILSILMPCLSFIRFLIVMKGDAQKNFSYFIRLVCLLFILQILQILLLQICHA